MTMDMSAPTPLNIRFSDDFLDAMKRTIPLYKYDQFEHYPAKEKDAWKRYFLLRLQNFLHDDQCSIFYKLHDTIPYLIGCSVSKWDEDHFGFKMAAIKLIFYLEDVSDLAIVESMLDKCIKVLAKKGVKVISARISGDMIPVIHLLEAKGFRYYENQIWPIVYCEGISSSYNKNVRHMHEHEIDRVLHVAQNYQYRHGHYDIDTKFDKNAVKLMFRKWVESAWLRKDPIIVIEHEGVIAGCFAYKTDNELSNALGYKYARMSFLALDSNLRGQGLGLDLFQGSMAIMKNMGAEYIDSSYAIRNHISAALHAKSSFYSVYQEATFHLWL